MTARAPKILVVDDSSEALAIYADLLGEAGYDVTAAENGVAALAAMGRRMPDLVLLDLQMPAMGGLELLDRVRERRATAPPVVAVSGLESLERAALSRGARAFLRKPVQACDLVAVIDAALEGVRCAWGELDATDVLTTAECSRVSGEHERPACP